MAAKGGVFSKSENGWWRSIRVKAILIILLMVVPLVLVGAISILYYQGVLKQNISDDLSGSAKTISDFIPTYMELSQIYLKSIADRPLVVKAMGSDDRAYLHEMADYTNATQRINSIYFANANGTVIESTPEMSRMLGTNASVHSYVSGVIHTGKPIIGDAEPDFDGMPVVPMALPIKDDNGTVIGVLVGTVDLNDLEKTLSGTVVVGNRHTYLVNRTGHIMTHTNPVYMTGMTDFSSVPAVQRALHGETGVAEYYNNVYNETVLGAYAPIQPEGWGVVISSPVSAAYQPVWNTTLPMIALFTLLTLIAVGLGLFFGNSIIAPISNLSQATRMAFKNEDYKRLLPLSRRDEIGDLGRSFNEMVETVKRTEGELRESIENFSALANNIPQLAWMARADGYIFWYNKQWYDFTGATPEEMQGWGWQKVHHPDYVKRITDEWQHSIDAETPFESVFPLRGKDGKYHWFLTRVTPVKDEQGKLVRWFGTNTDITERMENEEALTASRNEVEKERKRAVDEKERAEIEKQHAELYVDLMGHDINNLNQSALGYMELVRNTANLTDEEREMVDASIASVNNSADIIANVRKLQKITGEELHNETVDIDQMIQACIKEAPRPEGKKVIIRYTPKKGLLVTGTPMLKEVFCNLIDNAIKHSGNEVEIDIQVKETQTVGRRLYEIEVSDNGNGIADEMKQKLFRRFQRGNTKAHGKGLGLYIAKKLVERFNGTIEVKDRVPGDHMKGARFIVWLPAKESSET